MVQIHDEQTLVGAFPSFLQNEVLTVIHNVPLTSRLNCTPSFEVATCNEIIRIPYRVYYEEPQPFDESGLTQAQQIIVESIFTRHHDGFVRQRRLRGLFSHVNEHEWLISYIAALIGEYVIEILNDIDQRIKEIDPDVIRKFCGQNPTFMKTTESRVISYWNEYYRNRFPDKRNYVGIRILEYIKGLSD